MKTSITKTSLLAVAAATLLSIGASAASAQEFTVPAADAGAYSAPANARPSQHRGEYVAFAYRGYGGNGQTATGGPSGGPNQGG
jgi:hypothetical protein